MSLLHKRRARQNVTEETELEVTPFMNLMIVLVPVLLLSLVFTQTTVIDLNFPSGESTSEPDPDAVHLEVAVYADRLVVGDGRGGAIKTLARSDKGHDFGQLSLVMRELKRRMPEKRDITLLLEDETQYQTLVHVMDVVRSHKALSGLDVVNAELFPVISLGTTVPPANAVPGEVQVSSATGTSTVGEANAS
jgi:biopolymer transport protein ExbD